MKVLVTLLLISALSQALTSTYSIPDLRINQETATCQTAQALLDFANQDMNRIQIFNVDIEASGRTLDAINTELSNTCPLHPLFLQANIRGKNSQSFTIGQMLNQVITRLGSDDLLNQMIGEGFNSIVVQLTRIP